MKYYGYVKYYIGGGLVMGAQEVSILFSNSQVLNSFKIKSPKKIRRGEKKKTLLRGLYVIMVQKIQHNYVFSKW